jgi:hypothetical protein
LLEVDAFASDDDRMTGRLDREVDRGVERDLVR